MNPSPDAPADSNPVDSGLASFDPKPIFLTLAPDDDLEGEELGERPPGTCSMDAECGSCQ